MRRDGRGSISRLLQCYPEAHEVKLKIGFSRFGCLCLPFYRLLWSSSWTSIVSPIHPSMKHLMESHFYVLLTCDSAAMLNAVGYPSSNYPRRQRYAPTRSAKLRPAYLGSLTMRQLSPNPTPPPDQMCSGH